MTDLLALKRMNNIIDAIDKMHNGLLALIDAHHELEKKLDDRIKRLEELSLRKCSQCGQEQVCGQRCDKCFGPLVPVAE